MDITDSVKAIIILGNDGKPVLSKYYGKIESKNFEKQIFVKTKSHKTKDEILMVDGCVVIHRCVCGLHIYVVGSRNENPLVLDRVLCCLVEVTSTLLSKNMEDQTIYQNLDQIIIALDEICDNGIILETDPNLVLERVCLRDDVAEQSVARILQEATEHIRFSWIRLS